MVDFSFRCETQTIPRFWTHPSHLQFGIAENICCLKQYLTCHAQIPSHQEFYKSATVNTTAT